MIAETGAWRAGVCPVNTSLMPLLAIPNVGQVAESMIEPAMRSTEAHDEARGEIPGF
jgi:hypothetical protein